MLNLNLRFDTKDNELLDFNNFYINDGIVYIDDSFSVKPIGTLLTNFLNTNFLNFSEFLNIFSKYGPFGYKRFFKKGYQSFIDSLLKEDLEYQDYISIVKNFYLNNYKYLLDFQTILINVISYTFNLDNNKTISSLNLLERNYLAVKKYDFNYNLDVKIQLEQNTISHSKNQYKQIFINLESEKDLIKDLKSKTIDIFTCINYQSNDILSLVLISLQQVIQNNKIIKKCKNCNKFFIPTSKSNEVFCDNIYKDTHKTCKAVGAAISYNNNLKKNDAQRKYRSTYSNWCMLIKRYPDIQSYKDNFEIWKKESKKFKDDIKNGLSTNDEFLEWLEIHKGGYSYGR